MTSFLLSALVLGLLSSLHCLGMCGPLVIGILPQNKSSLGKTGILILYHSGRLLVYGLLGFVAGLIGQKLFIGNLQQSLSISLGVILILFVLSKYFPLSKYFRLNFINTYLNRMMGYFLSINNFSKYIFLGGLNGLLPCGMVYIALAGAFSITSALGSFLFMIVFGLGTLPLLTLISGVGVFLKAKTKMSIIRWQPVFLTFFAILLIVRGLNLGIPYFSPQIVESSQTKQMECCKVK